MENSIVNQLKKINFKRDKKNPIILERDLSNLQTFAKNQLKDMLTNGSSFTTSMLKVKSALIERSIEISQMKDKYVSYSVKDNYTTYLQNIITAHLDVSVDISNSTE